MDIDKILAFNRLREEELRRRSEMHRVINAWRERQGTATQTESASKQEWVQSGSWLRRLARLTSLFLS